MLAGEAVDVEAGIEVPVPGRTAAAAASHSPRISLSLFNSAWTIVGIGPLAGEAALGGVGLVHVKHAVCPASSM